MKPTEITGRITRFSGNGRKLGYPTANLTYKTDLADGVYFGTADLKEHKKRPSIIFIGVPSTMGDTDRRVETHVLDIPDEDYYDEDLKIVVMHFHRANKKFSNIEDLVEAMQSDEQTARAWFKSHDLLT